LFIILFSIICKLEKTIDISLYKSEKLRKSIFKYAFEGKLVPQDPLDDPVDILLKRTYLDNISFQKKNEKQEK